MIYLSSSTAHHDIAKGGVKVLLPSTGSPDIVGLTIWTSRISDIGLRCLRVLHAKSLAAS